MRTAEFKDFCKTLKTKFDSYYCGRLDSKKNHSLGVYNLKGSDKPALSNFKKTYSEDFSLLIHWDNNYDNTEKQARELQTELETIQNVLYGKYNINCIKIHFSEPVDVDTDEKGIFERVIELSVFYSKEE